jgi:hypothetical protein
MNKKISILLIALLVLAGFGKADKSSIENNSEIVVNNTIAFDLTKNYEQKSISLNVNIDSVEYILLETNDDFLCADGKIVTFTDELIIYSNENWHGGDILIFDKKGKALKKINHKYLRDDRERDYSLKTDVVYDDSNRELFVNDGGLRKIFVYDLEGNYKRSFPYLAGIEILQLNLVNFDDEHLLCNTFSEKIEHKWFLISKQTGEKIQDILIPVKKKISTVVGTEKIDNNFSIKTVLPIKFAVDNGDSWILNEPSSDTIFSIGKDRILKPLLVRTPTVGTMNPEILISAEAKIDNYLFINSYNININNKYGQPSEFYTYNHEENKIYKHPRNIIPFTIMQNDQVMSRKLSDILGISFSFPYLIKYFIKHNTKKNVIMGKLEADNLIEAYEKSTDKDGFSKKYKEMVSKIKKGDDSVFVKIKLEE